MLIHAWRGVSSIGWWRQACVMGLVIFASGCGKPDSEAEAPPKPKYEVADDETPDKAAPPSVPAASPLDMAPTGTGQPAPKRGTAPGTALQQPPSIPSEQLDAITVPQGTPAELMAFLKQLGERASAMSLQLQTQGPNANLTGLQQLFEAMLAASDKVLAADIDLETRRQAIDYKAGALQMLIQVAPDPSWTEQTLEFAKSLAADTNPSIAIEGRAILLGILVGEISQGRSKDVNGLMSQLKSLLADEARNVSVLIITQQAVMALGNLGREKEALEALTLIANAFQDHPDPKLAAEANEMQDQLALMQIDTKLNEVVLKREGADAAFLEAVTQLLQRPKTGEGALRRALQYLRILEQSGNYALATTVCELIQTACKNAPTAETELGKEALSQTDITLRRLNLLGKPLSVEGNLLDGSPLDFAPYQGKVVLLAFWSSMSPPCRPELLAVKSVYEKYHAQGFEVLGICLDQDPAATAQFLDETQLPWVTITNNKLAEQCGVEVIPYLLLIDAQGNVADLFLRGASLEAKLAGMLGAEPTQPPAPAASDSPGR